MNFAAFAEAYLALSRSMHDDERAAIGSSLLASIERDADLVTATRWLAREHPEFRPAIASSLPVRVYELISGESISEMGSLDQELFLASRSMASSSIEAIRMLLDARARAGLNPLVRSESLSLEQITRAVDELGATSGVAAKTEALAHLWRAMSADEIATLHLIFSRSVAGGVDDETLAEAIARAFAQPLQLVRHALAIEGDPGRTAHSARHGQLEATFVRPMRLISPMRAVAIARTVDDDGSIRLERRDDVDIATYVVEHRLPGTRAQLHVWTTEHDDAAIALLMSSGRDISPALPHLVRSLAALAPGMIIDGHVIVADDDEAIMDATSLERAAAKGAVAESVERAARFVGFDLLVSGGVSLLEHSYDDRRFALERIAASAGIELTRVRSVYDHDDFERAYASSLALGQGVIAKRRDAPYAFGRRTTAWLKAPGEPETLLAVVRYASAGPEGRDGPPGELTFGVWLADGGEARLVNIGRVECAVDDDDLARLTEQLRLARGKQFGPNYEIEPRIVCELEYDAIRASSRTDAGYTIRIACIRCICWDYDVQRAATVAEIERRHRLRARSGSLEHAVYVPGT